MRVRIKHMERLLWSTSCMQRGEHGGCFCCGGGVCERVFYFLRWGDGEFVFRGRRWAVFLGEGDGEFVTYTIRCRLGSSLPCILRLQQSKIVGFRKIYFFLKEKGRSWPTQIFFSWHDLHRIGTKIKVDCIAYFTKGLKIDWLIYTVIIRSHRINGS